MLLQTKQLSSNLSGSPWTMTIITVGFVAFFYFIIVRPQSKKRKAVSEMLKSIKKGDRIVSIGGIHGKIASIKENEITIKIDSNAAIILDKSAISKVVGLSVDSKEVTKNK